MRIRWIDRLTSLTGRVVAWLTLLMALLTVLVVVLRYAFNIGVISLQEAVVYAHACVVMLGMAYTLQQDEHVRVDVFYARRSARGKAWINLLGHCLFLVPVSVAIFWFSLAYVRASWRIFEGSSEVGGIPGIFLLKTLIPTMAMLLLLQGLAEIFKLIAQLRNKPAADVQAQP